MITLISKPTCPFCHALHNELQSLGITHEVKFDKKQTVVPLLYDNETLVFKGLPNRSELCEYFGRDRNS